MSCRTVRRRLPPYIDGELQKDIGAEVSHHLTSCERCRVEYERINRFCHLLEQRYARRTEFPVELTDRVITRMREEKRPLASSTLSRRRWVYEVAALLLVVLVATILLQTRRGREPLLVRPVPLTPVVTQTIAAAASSRTLQKVEELLRRHEAPLPRPAYAKPPVTCEGLFPAFLEESARQSEEALRKMLQSRINVTKREKALSLL